LQSMFQFQTRCSLKVIARRSLKCQHKVKMLNLFLGQDTKMCRFFNALFNQQIKQITRNDR